MSVRCRPHAEFTHPEGATVKIHAGDLSEFPAWFRDELNGLLGRLRQESDDLARSTSPGKPPPAPRTTGRSQSA